MSSPHPMDPHLSICQVRAGFLNHLSECTLYELEYHQKDPRFVNLPQGAVICTDNLSAQQKYVEINDVCTICIVSQS